MEKRPKYALKGNAIKQLENTDVAIYYIQDNKKKKEIRTQYKEAIRKKLNKHKHRRMNRQQQIMKELRTKFHDQDIVIVRVDNKQTIVLLRKTKYNDKVEKFLNEQEFFNT